MEKIIISNWYKPKKVTFHLRLLAIIAVLVFIQTLIMKQSIISEYSLYTFIVGAIFMEVFSMWSFYIIRFGKEANSQREFIRNALLGLVRLYVLCLVSGALIFCLFRVVLYLAKDLNLVIFMSEYFHNQFIHEVGALSVGLLFSIPIFLYIEWQSALKREYKLKEANLIFQNETLKNQVNPHFLFNSLNTLSSLVNTQTEIASHFISKLSLIYRYILENGTKVKVPLKVELAFIKDYFYLHEIRSEGKILLSIEIKDYHNYEILPVSLQLLIENAIKHNMATLEKPLKITIYIEGENIVVRNNLQKMATQVVSTKIGLKNLSERVRLITGKKIIIEETNSDYLVKVPLLS
jgi:sensor histidine kinase YesM